MNLLSDILLAAGAFATAAYCFVLARRLKRFTQLEGGMGGAIAVLSAQVDEMTRALASARKAANASAETLEQQTRRAEAAARRIELLLASLHDLPQETSPRTSGRPPERPVADKQSDGEDRKLHFVRRRAQRRPEPHQEVCE